MCNKTRTGPPVRVFTPGRKSNPIVYPLFGRYHFSISMNFPGISKGGQFHFDSSLCLLAHLVLLPLPGILYSQFQNLSQSNPTFDIASITQDDPLFDGEVRFAARGPAPVVMDYNEDGWLDIYLLRWQMPDILLLNNGNGTFSQVENPLSLDPHDGGNIPIWADFDNDGHKDLFLATLKTNRYLFYHNKGDGGFVEEAIARGVDLRSEDLHSGAGAATGDINRDGYLDIVVGDWGGPAHEPDRRQHFALFLNQGASNPGYFTNITDSAGLELPPGTISVFAPLVSDLDADGWPDLPIVSDFKKSTLFFNNTDNTFVETTEASGVGLDSNGMGTAIGDVNGDGRLDWWVTSIGYAPTEDDPTFTGNQLYLNQGDRKFLPLAVSRGVAYGGWAWGSVFFDFDNDGDLDIVLTNENDFVPVEGTTTFTKEEGHLKLWENSGAAYFTEVSKDQKVNISGNGGTVVSFDFDNDGDLDLFATHQFTNPLLLRNNNPVDNHWIRISLRGTLSNRDGIGACITLQTEEGGPEQVAEYNPTNAYRAQLEPVVHFGLGEEADRVHRVSIKWPSGIVQQIYDLPTDQHITVTEEGEISSLGEAPIITTQPPRLALQPGDTLVLSVSASGVPSPTYQWFHNGNMISGATSSTYRIEAAQREDAGKYYVTATNTAGIAYSHHARVSVRSSYSDKSVARQWNEEILEAIRLDYPAPTVHSRNLFTLSAAMWDAWASYDSSGLHQPFLSIQAPAIPAAPDSLQKFREEAISYAAYRVLSSRYRLSPQAHVSLDSFRQRMSSLGYDPDEDSLDGNSPAAVGNRIALQHLAFGWTDGANEAHAYADQTGYIPLNDPLIVSLPGTDAQHPNLWQPLSLSHLVLQNGIVVGDSVQEFLGPNWGWVTPFALTREHSSDVYLDPGPPPLLGTDTEQDFKDAVLELIEFQGWYDPSDGVTIDVSPGARHNNSLGTNDGQGYAVNPVTGQPYLPNLVLRADYGRILAEFWADGPDSETPPGHWNSIANAVTDHPDFSRRFEGLGAELPPLEWDVKLYFCINAALYDAAIACWDAKRKYNYVRPITMIRYMGGKGQSSDLEGPSYHQHGLPLKAGLVEVITEASTAEGEHHAHLADYMGEIALLTWKGIPENPNTEIGGVGWIRAVEWMPYQRQTFVSPPFGAYTSGHSTFSRAAAEVLAAITGSAFFPGGMSSFSVKANEFLEFEVGPQEDVTLTWATYFDAADEAGISRLYGGIHVWADDLRGRIMGSDIGKSAFQKARSYFTGESHPRDWRATFEDWVNAMMSDPNQVSAPGPYFENPTETLASFFLGFDPLFEGSAPIPLQIGMDSTNRNPQIRFKASYSLTEPYWDLQISSDLINWSLVPDNQIFMERVNLGEGKIEINLRDPEPLSSFEGARFYRVRPSQK